MCIRDSYRAGRIAEFEPDSVAPILSARNIEQPVFVTHGTADRRINFQYGKENFDNLASTKKVFYPVEGAHHTDLWHVGGGAYFTEVLNFLDTYAPNSVP